jgi:UDP-2,3-diacylglucosamine hydrolase
MTIKQAFISDLHLEEARPDITNLFIRFLNQTNVDELYILGDFFESWIGDDNLTPFNQLMMDALKSATKRGLTIYFLRGNRDFLIGKKFLRNTGCVLLPDEYVITIAGKKTLLMHGDTLCTEDKAYLKFRKKARCWLVQKLFLLKSLETRRGIAQRYRDASKSHTSTMPDYIMDVTQAEVERVMLKHRVLDLIHGHTHRPNVHEFSLQGQPATRTVLAAWHEQGSVLICNSDGQREWQTLTNAKE